MRSMTKNNENMRIAGVKTINDWNELKLKLDVNNNNYWDEAFSFFEKRIETRYFKPIEAILNICNDEGEGFAIVNLQCSLIETIECFINGWISSFEERKTVWRKYNGDIIHKSNKKIFISFFKNRNPFKILDIDGKGFYKNVRCGLLHETQTKDGWKINTKVNNDKAIENKIIYRENFHSDIKKTIEDYKSAIIKKEDFDNSISVNDLRQNFKDKFNHICDIS